MREEEDDKSLLVDWELVNDRGKDEIGKVDGKQSGVEVRVRRWRKTK